MQNRFKHAQATHAAMTVLGYRRNGAPIYTIAGGSTPPEPVVTPPAPTPVPAAPATPPAPVAPTDDPTDWKAHSRDWEKKAKANLAELEKLRTANLSEQEKALETAKAEGRAEATSGFGKQLAAAEFKGALAAAGLQLGEAAGLIDTSKFVTDTGDVDAKAIKAAVDSLAKLAPPRPGRSGTDGGGTGGSGDKPNDSLDTQIAEALKAGNIGLSISLKRRRAALNTT